MKYILLTAILVFTMTGEVRAACGTGNPAGGAQAPEVSFPMFRQVVQRNDNNVGQIPIVATIAGGADCVDVAVLRTSDGVWLTPWTVVGSGVEVSHSIAVGGGGWYRVFIRAWQGGRIGITWIDKVGVGEVYITAGQSNICNSGPDVHLTPDDRVSSWNGVTWQYGKDPQPLVDGLGGSMMPYLGTRLVEALNVPVGFINVAKAGSSVTQWQPGQPGYFPRFQAALSITRVRAILWQQGETDSAHAMSADTYAAYLNRTIRQSQAESGYQVKWVVAQGAFGYGVNAAQTKFLEGTSANIRKGQRAVVNNATVFGGPDTDTLLRPDRQADGLHFNEIGEQTQAQLWAYALLAKKALSGPK